MYRKILIPLDGSEQAQAILTHLSGFLAIADADVILLGAVEGPETPTVDERELLEAAQVRASGYLKGVAEGLRSGGIRARAEVRVGPAAKVILDTSVADSFDLIALASHGYSGLNRLFYGSTAEKVLRHADVPVLLVKSYSRSERGVQPLTPAAPHPLTWKGILVPLDGSKHAEWALPMATALAERHGATLHLVRVVPIVPKSGFFVAPEAFDYDIAPEQAYLEDLAAKLRETGLEVRTEVGQGAPGDFIRAYLDEYRVGLVVMTTHGRTGWRRWLLGSVAEGLLRSIQTPILLRRLEERDP